VDEFELDVTLGARRKMKGGVWVGLRERFDGRGDVELRGGVKFGGKGVRKGRVQGGRKKGPVYPEADYAS